MDHSLKNPLVLAYLGDSVLEMHVRMHLIEDLQIGKVNQMNKMALDYVSAAAQQDFVEHLLAQDLLEPLEKQIYLRGRNHKEARSKKSNHHHSTGFEAILGYHHLSDNQVRIQEILELYYQYNDTK